MIHSDEIASTTIFATTDVNYGFDSHVVTGIIWWLIQYHTACSSFSVAVVLAIHKLLTFFYLQSFIGLAILTLGGVNEGRNCFVWLIIKYLQFL